MRAFRVTSLALSLLAVANAAVVNVTVGSNGTLIYRPWTVTAVSGDVIVFRFVSKTHTVTQSTFADPCTPLVSGADSGFLSASNNSHPTFNFTVTNSSTPFWFFCAVEGHCIDGMVFAVNPTPEKSFDAFQAKAKSLAQPNNTTPSTPSPVSGTSTSASPTDSDSAAIKLGESNIGIMTAFAVLFGLVL